MKEVPTVFKEKTIAVDFDGVIHLYSRNFQGLDNAYDPPTPGTREALQKLKDSGYRLIIVSSRPVPTIKRWLDKYDMSDFFDDVSNIKHPARYYIDDHGLRFPRGEDNPWEKTLRLIKELDSEKENKNEK